MEAFDKDSLDHIDQAIKVRKKILRSDQFLSTPIHVGMPMFMELRFQSGKIVKTQTKLIGYEAGKLIIVQTPILNGDPVTYSVNSTVVVRYMVDGEVYGFNTSVMAVFSSPTFMTFLNYPDIVEQVSLRGKPRVQVVIPIYREGGDPNVDCILNLSGTGALLQMSDIIRPNEVYRISFNLPTGVAINDIKCTVKQVNMSSYGYFAGVQFDKNHKDFSVFDQYVNKVMETLVAFGLSQTKKGKLGAPKMRKD